MGIENDQVVHNEQVVSYQIECSFKAPCDIFLSSVECSPLGLGNCSWGFCGVAFNDSYDSMSSNSFLEKEAKNAFGIFIDGVESSTLPTNEVKQGQEIKVVFPVVNCYLWGRFLAFEGDKSDNWAITIQAEKTNGEVLENTTWQDKTSAIYGLATYLVGNISPTEAMVDDLVLEYNNV